MAIRNIINMIGCIGVLLCGTLHGTAQVNADLAIINAVKQNDKPVIEELLRSGANINAVDSNLATPLMWAASSGNLSLFKWLVQKGADYKKKGIVYLDSANESYYGNILCIAAGKNDTLLLAYCLDDLKIPVDDKEYNPDTKQTDGWTALQWAASKGSLASVQILVKHAANRNETGGGQQPLMLAVQNGYTEICLMLLDWNVGPALRNATYKANHDYAFTKKDYPTALLLEKYQNGYTREQIKTLMDSIKTENVFYASGDSCKQRRHYKCAIENLLKGLGYSRLLYSEKHPSYATTLNFIALLYEEMGDYKKALPMYQQALKIRSDVLGGRHPDYANSLNNLGELYGKMGDYQKALPLHQQAIQIRKESLGEKSTIYISMLNNLATIYENMGSYNNALPLYQQALTICKELLGEKHPTYALVLHNLAALYISMGNYKDALPLHQLAFQINKEVLGEKHLNFAHSATFLASLYERMGNYQSALPLFRQALQIRKEVLGETHPDYASSLFNLAGLYKVMGDYKAALPLYLQGLQIRKLVSGEKNINYATGLNNLAGLYQSLGSYNQASPLYQQALEISLEVQGEKHPNYALSLINLASSKFYANQFDEAFKLLEKARQIFTEALDKKHPLYLSVLDHLAGLYETTGRHEKAFPLYQQVLQARKEILGEKHPDYIMSLNELAGYYASIGNYNEALPLYQQVLQLRKEILGEGHTDYARSLSNLGGLYNTIGSYDKVLPLYQEAMQIRKQVLGTKHPDYSRSLTDLGSFYKQIGNYDKALAFYKEALQIDTEVWGDKHANYAASINNLASLYQDLGDYNKALPLFQQAVQIDSVVFGNKHRSYTSSINNLALLYKKLGNREKALSLYQEALPLIKEVLGENHPFYAVTLSNLADLYEEMNVYDKDITSKQQALRIIKNVLGEKHPDYALYLFGLGIAYYMNTEIQKASNLLGQANSIMSDNLNNGSRFLNHTDMNRFISDNYNHFEISNSIALKHKDLPLFKLGLQTELTFKGLVLQNNKDLLATLHLSSNPVLKKLTDQFIATRNQLAVLSEKNAPSVIQDSVTASLDDIEQHLMLQSPEYQQMIKTRNIQWQQVQRKLKPDEAAIEFVKFHYWDKRWTDTTQYAAFLLLPAGEPRMIALCDKKILEQRINDTLDKNEQYVKGLYEVKERGITITNVKKDSVPSLYQLLWQPLDSLLTGINTIYYAPDGLLHRINLAAINYSGKKVLGDKYVFHLMGSTREVVSYKSDSIDSRNDTLLLYGGIDFNMDSSFLAQQHQKYNPAPTLNDGIATRSGNSFEWLPLDGSAEELASIQTLAVNQNIPAHSFTEKEATEESFIFYTHQVRSPALVYIASHGFFYPDEQRKKTTESGKNAPYFMSSASVLQRSGIVFAGANQVTGGQQPIQGIEDGIVTAYDISNVNLLSTKLMVLSACETGLGKIENTEGVFGLQRAIRMAGCKNLLMSLWKVPDEQTARFMKYFYTQLIQEKKTIYNSFQIAQKQMRELYSGQPYFWAGFVLME